MVNQYSQHVTAFNGGLYPTRPQGEMCFCNKLNKYKQNYEAQFSLRATTQAQSQTEDEFTRVCSQNTTQFKTTLLTMTAHRYV
jgi:hypothetical protein